MIGEEFISITKNDQVPIYRRIAETHPAVGVP
jgi:hypothetical protein